MSQQYSTALRNAWLADWETQIGASPHVHIQTGAPPANCAAAATGTTLAIFDLAADWASAPSGGVSGFNNLPIVDAGIADGNAGHYRIYNNATTVCHEQGTVTVAGGGGDMIIDNVAIATGQVVQILSYTKTAPGA